MNEHEDEGSRSIHGRSDQTIADAQHQVTVETVASGVPVKERQPWPPAPPPPPPVDSVKRDNALAFLDKLGVKVDPLMKNPAQIKEIEDYRKGVSEGF